MKSFAVFSFFILLYAEALYASACCSGGSAIPSVITGDDRFQLGSSFSSSFVVGEVNSDGESSFYNDITEESLYALNLSSAFMFSYRIQAGVQIPFQWRSVGESSEDGISDIKLNVAWEAFPLYSYSVWRPQFFIFAAMSFPTGKSTYESANPRVDTFGKGFYTPSLGFLTQKSWRRFDTSLSGEWGFPQARRFDSGKVDPGFNYSAMVSIGYRLSSFRVGLSVGPNYEEAKKLEGSSLSGGSKLVWDSSLLLSYTQNDFWSYSLSYLDQSLIGPAKNTKLNRSLSVGINYRIPQ